MKFKCIAMSLIMILSVALCVPSYAATDADSYSLYSYLTGNKKAIYDAFSADPLAENFIVTLPEPLEYDSPYSGGVPQDFSVDMFESICAGLYAFAYDHPQYLWFSTFSVSEYKPEITDNPDGTFHIKETMARITPKLDTNAFSSNTDLRNKTAQLVDCVNSIEITGNTIYERVKSIHDTIINLVTYDPNLGKTGENPTDHYPHGVFLSPHIAVCEGYAAAFKMLCDREKIPCIIVVGKLNGYGHAWNYIKLDNGKWYAVDCTRDDNGENIYYDDFFAGQNTIANHFQNSDDSRNFSGSHSPDGKLWLFKTFSFTYPMLSENSFSMMLLSPDSKASISMNGKSLLIPPGSTADMQAEAPYGYIFMAFNSSTGSTGSIIKTDDMSQTDYTIIMRGDTVSDAAVDVSDYNKVIDTATQKDGALVAGSNEYLAGDMNGDGVIDLFDAAEIDLYISGKKS